MDLEHESRSWDQEEWDNGELMDMEVCRKEVRRNEEGNQEEEVHHEEEEVDSREELDWVHLSNCFSTRIEKKVRLNCSDASEIERRPAKKRHEPGRRTLYRVVKK